MGSPAGVRRRALPALSLPCLHVLHPILLPCSVRAWKQLLGLCSETHGTILFLTGGWGGLTFSNPHITLQMRKFPLFFPEGKARKETVLRPPSSSTTPVVRSRAGMEPSSGLSRFYLPTERTPAALHSLSVGQTQP